MAGKPNHAAGEASPPPTYHPGSLADLIEGFIGAVSQYLQWTNLGRISAEVRLPCSPGSPAEAAMLEEIREQHERRMDAMEAVRSMGGRLAPALSRAGYDATGVAKVLHYIAEGGGPDRAFPIWDDVKADLRQIQWGLAGTPAGVLFAYLVAADSLLPHYIDGLADDDASVNAARARVQRLVMVEIGPLRTRVEDSAPEASRPRVREALSNVESAAWDLMRSLDGRKRSDLIVDRKLRRGPWTEPLERLRSAVQRAHWLVRDDPRLLQSAKAAESAPDRAAGEGGGAGARPSARVTPEERERRERTVRDHIRSQREAGASVETITRDGVANATGVPASAVSATNAWRGVAAEKKRARSPRRLNADPVSIDAAIEARNWDHVRAAQDREARQGEP